MKKEEFLTKLRKNLSVLEEREIQDIVEEYEQHIDMKMKDGLSEEAAIHDFGDLKELTAGILEAYHVKTNYHTEKKNIDFEKMKEESKKATEKATTVIGKSAGALGKGAETAGKWGLRQMKKLIDIIKWPFIQLKKNLRASKTKAQGRGFWGKIWLLVLGICSFIFRCIVWGVCLLWNIFFMFIGMLAVFCTLGCIFSFGVLIVLLAIGYPVVGVTIITIGGGLVSSSVMLYCFSLLRRKSDEKDKGDIKQDFDKDDFNIEESKGEDNDWEYPEDNPSQGKKLTVNSYQEVPYHA